MTRSTKQSLTNIFFQGNILELYRYVTFFIQYGLLVFEFVLSLQVDLPNPPKYERFGEKEPLLSENKKNTCNETVTTDNKEWVNDVFHVKNKINIKNIHH